MVRLNSNDDTEEKNAQQSCSSENSCRLLHSVDDVEENFAIPVSSQLEEYEKEIATIDVERPCEEVALKLAEGSCVVDGAVHVYGKKVDDFYDLVLKFRDKLREMNSANPASAAAASTSSRCDEHYVTSQGLEVNRNTDEVNAMERD